MTVRTFIAVELQKPLKQALYDAGQALASRLGSARAVRWVEPENMHLTIRFLGETQESVIDSIIVGMDSVANESSAFHLELDRLGCFPNPRNPRVVWIGLKGEDDRLQTLHQDLSIALEEIGWKPEPRPFRGHLTIGRVKDRKQVVDAKFPWGLEVDPLQLNVNSIALIESQLKPTGAIYTVLHRSVFLG